MKRFWDMPEYKFNGGYFGGVGGNGGNGNDNNSSDENEDENDDENEHEHVYVNIVHSENISAFEELTHQVLTLEFQDRGLSLDFSLEEAEELGHVLAEIMRYIEKKRAL